MNKNNQGSIFKNKYKKDNQKAPDYKGQIVVDTVLKDIALWFNPAKEGKQAYFSVKISDPYVKGQPAAIPESVPENSDDLPFNQ